MPLGAIQSASRNALKRFRIPVDVPQWNSTVPVWNHAVSYTMSLALSHSSVRFPVTIGADRNTAQQQYVDIGTSINSWVWLWSGDRYLLSK